MTKQYKRAKPVKIEYEEIIIVRSVYTCPFCKTEIHGGIDNKVIRFRCSHCNNILEVKQ